MLSYLLGVLEVLSSPRRRRRVAWVTAASLAIGSAALVMLLLPEGHPLKETFSNEPAQVAEKQTRLRPADRRSIDQTLDAFLLAALDRHDPARAWRLAGPDLRAGSTLADWEKGTMPTPFYRTRQKTFHGWSQVFAYTNDVSFQLLVQPKNAAKVGPIALSVEMTRRTGGWAVNRIYTAAEFSPVGQKAQVVGPNDFAAAAGSSAGPGNSNTSHGRLGGAWIGSLVGIFALGLLAVAIFASRNWIRYRRVRREVSQSSTSVMPSLPETRRRQDGHRDLVVDDGRRKRETRIGEGRRRAFDADART